MLMLLFYLYPTTSAVIMSAFQCSRFDAGDGQDFMVMTADHAVECGTEEHEAILTFARLMLAFPIGVPIVVGVLLHQRRAEIAGRGSLREGGPELSALSFLFRVSDSPASYFPPPSKHPSPPRRTTHRRWPA